MSTLLFLGGIGGWEILLILFVYGIILLFPLVALINCLKSEWKDNTNKLVWVIVIIIVPIVGVILYFVIGRNQRG